MSDSTLMADGFLVLQYCIGGWSPWAMEWMLMELRSFNANGNSETWKLEFDSLDSRTDSRNCKIRCIFAQI